MTTSKEQEVVDKQLEYIRKTLEKSVRYSVLTPPWWYRPARFYYKCKAWWSLMDALHRGKKVGTIQSYTIPRFTAEGLTYRMAPAQSLEFVLITTTFKASKEEEEEEPPMEPLVPVVKKVKKVKKKKAKTKKKVKLPPEPKPRLKKKEKEEKEEKVSDTEALEDQLHGGEKASAVQQVEKKKSKLADIPCDNCGVAFTPKCETHRYCCKRCVSQASTSRLKTNLVSKDTPGAYEFVCRGCGETFWTTTITQRYCSYDCRLYKMRKVRVEKKSEVDGSYKKRERKKWEKTHDVTKDLNQVVKRVIEGEK